MTFYDCDDVDFDEARRELERINQATKEARKEVREEAKERKTDYKFYNKNLVCIKI